MTQKISAAVFPSAARRAAVMPYFRGPRGWPSRPLRCRRGGIGVIIAPEEETARCTAATPETAPNRLTRGT
jgi:hypothetical protein